MPDPDFDFKHAAVIGCGSIGASWAALFAAHDISVRVYDPNPAAEQFLTTILKEAVSVLQELGHYKTSAGFDINLEYTSSRIMFTTDLPNALESAEIVQENGPEDSEIKAKILAELDDLLDPSVLILTSTSGLPCSSMQRALTKSPERFAVGHPFNPPHLIPLVEIVGGSLTSPQTLEKAQSFYRYLGRKPIVLKHEVPGHVANRLQSALMREIIHLVSEDVATVQEIDTAMEYGPGLRWGVMGPSLLMHLGGGPGGAEYYAEKLLAPLLSWSSGGGKELNDSSRVKWVGQTLAAAAGKSYVEISRRRDAGVLTLLKWRSCWENNNRVDNVDMCLGPA